MTQALTEPTIDVPIEIVPDEQTCPAGIEWCNVECLEDDDPKHHTSGFDYVTASRFKRDDVDLSVSVVREDAEDGTPGPVQVYLLSVDPVDEFVLTPAQARQIAATLLNAADMADPLPTGAMVTTAAKVRLGDKILTADGWQIVVGQMAFAESNDSYAQVNVWTDDYDHDPETDGWNFGPNDAVQVRRPIHGSCAIQFVEPLP